jgi:hypothetical protein
MCCALAGKTYAFSLTLLLSTCLAGRSRAVAAMYAISVVRTAACRRLEAKNEVLYGVEDDASCTRKRKSNRSMNNSSVFSCQARNKAIVLSISFGTIKDPEL